MVVRRRARLIPLLAAPAVVAVGLSVTALPTASAQTNSRICGNYWTAETAAPSANAPQRRKHMIIARYMEVYKGTMGAAPCNEVMYKTDNNPVATNYPDWAQHTWSDRNSVHQMECEAFTRDILLRSVNKPDGSVETDICQQMNKANSVAEVDAQTAWQNRMSYYYCPDEKRYDAAKDVCA